MSKGTNRSLFGKYDELVSKQLALQLLHPPATGSFSGRITVSLLPNHRPTLELELCQGYLNQPLVAETFTPEFASASSKSIVFDMLLPIITLYDMQYVQVLNRETVKEVKDCDLHKLLMSKYNECIDCKENSMLIIMVDELIGSSAQHTLTYTKQTQHSKAQEYATVVSDTDTISTSLSSANTTRNTQTKSLAESLSRAKHASFSLDRQVSNSDQVSGSVTHNVSQGWTEAGDDVQKQFQILLQKSVQHTISQTITNSTTNSLQFSRTLEETIRSEVSAAIEKSVTQAFEKSKQTVRQQSENNTRSVMQNEQHTLAANFQPLHQHNLDAIVTFARDMHCISFNQQAKPLIVFVINSAITQIALHKNLSWGSLEEPQHKRLSIRADHVTAHSIKNIAARIKELEYLKILSGKSELNSIVPLSHVSLLPSLQDLDIKGVNFDCSLSVPADVNAILRRFNIRPNMQ